MNLHFHMPTKVFFGRDTVLNNGAVLSTLGSKALIVTGKNSAKINGSFSDVEKVLTENNISFELFDEIEPNPSVETVIRGAEIAKSFGAEFIIGIGGGSPMDAAKAIALASTNSFTSDPFKQSYSNLPLPICTIPTTAGTGSEVTQYAILTDKINETKRSIANPSIFPKYSFLDGKYMMELSKSNTINTVIDAFSHAAEGYLSARATDLSDSFAIGSMNIIGKLLQKLDLPLTVEERDKLLYASMLAGITIAHTGTTIVHGMGYSLTYFLNIDHGRANGIIFPEYLRFCQQSGSDKVRNLLRAMKLGSINDFEMVIKRLFGKFEAVNEEQIIKFASFAVKTANIVNTVPEPTENDIVKIYKNSFKI